MTSVHRFKREHYEYDKMLYFLFLPHYTLNYHRFGYMEFCAFMV